MKCLKPVIDLFRLAWLDFKLATVDPLAPNMPQMRIERNEIARPTR